MLNLPDPARVRAILETDRHWAVYALGDLAPAQAGHCEWRVAADDSALLLIYRAFDLPVLFTLGRPEAVAPLLDAVRDPRLYLLARPEILPLLQARGAVTDLEAMWRMVLTPERRPPLTAATEAAALGPADFPALEALYADGAATGEAPDFFSYEQVAEGLFFGVWEAGALSAAAGTHLFWDAAGVGTVGNVYVRRDRRGRGLGAAVTGAVTAGLLQRGLTTIALNVSQTNAAAQRVYARLGYARYCPFYEGEWRPAGAQASGFNR